MAYLMSVDFDKDAAKLDAKSGEYTESVLAFMMASSTDLAAFKGRGGKLLIAQGVSDPVFSIEDTIHWWNEVNRAKRLWRGRFREALRGTRHESLRRGTCDGSVRCFFGAGELGRKELGARPDCGDGRR